ncbi:MAG: cellulase family glycosylhydrolase [Saccharofermentanales bacterium]
MLYKKEGFRNFIAVDPRTKDRLMDGDIEFRFVGMNPQNFDPAWMKGYPDWKVSQKTPDEYELEDIIRTSAQMGSTVVRDYTLSVGETRNGIERHVMAPGVFSETAFERLDKIFEYCNKYEVRLILGLVDFQENIGRISTYAEWRGKEKEEFFTDPQVITDFKMTIDYVTNRYKDEKALLCWETGNEMPIDDNTDKWVREITGYIKSKDPNHLIEDGRLGGYNGIPRISEDSLSNPYVDIIGGHYYHWVQGIDYAAYCAEDRAQTKGRKVYIVEEFGYANADLSVYHSLLDEVITNGTSGVMIWALAHRNKNGGFYWHDGNHAAMGEFWTYHWPGFETGRSYNETETFDLMRKHAYEIRGMEMPPMPVPEKPFLLPSDKCGYLNWRGSTGATSYDVEKASFIDGPWTIIGKDITDCTKGYEALFIDREAASEENPGCYYRVIAKNNEGVSNPSNIIKS